MKSFDKKYLSALTIPHHLITIVRRIGEHKGKQDLYKKQAPEMLENLRNVAIIQSTESSNRLEGITADIKRIRELVEEKTKPANRSEAEIAGYRDVLNTISTILAAYTEFEGRFAGVSSGRGSKTDIVLNAIESYIGDFGISDLEKACPAVSRDMLRHILKKLKTEGEVISLGQGRFARWRKVK